VLCLAEQEPSMDVPDQFIEQLKHEIANLKAMLEPLESGRMHMGTKRPGEPWTQNGIGCGTNTNRSANLAQFCKYLTFLTMLLPTKYLFNLLKFPRASGDSS
jgi:hypothetical protein